MFIELLRPEWVLPDGSNYVLADLRLLVPAGRTGELLIGQSRFMGRLNPKGAGFTSVMTQTAPTPEFGTADTGVEFGAGLDLANTTPHGGAATPLYPFVRLRVSGTVASGDTAARLVMASTAPLYGIEVLAARDGLPFKAGDDLVRSGIARVLAA